MKQEKIEQIILAGALGDAFGYEIEFYNTAKIKLFYGENGLIDYPVKNNHLFVSDDTQMTLFCQQACYSYLNLNHLQFTQQIQEKLITQINEKYCNWYQTQTYKFKSHYDYENELMNFESLWALRAPGNTCLSALERGGNGRISVLSNINNSKGCGGIMRVAPIAFLEADIETIFDLGAKQAALTHGHPDGYLSSAYFATVLNLIAKDYDTLDSLNIANEILKKYKSHENFLNQIMHLQHLISEDKTYYAEELNKQLGECWVGDEAFTVAFYCFIKAKNFEDCLILASNHNGDSDSTATLAAQLYAAKYGLSDEAKKNIQHLDVLPAIHFLFKKIEDTLNNTVNKTKFKT